MKVKVLLSYENVYGEFVKEHEVADMKAKNKLKAKLAEVKLE